MPEYRYLAINTEGREIRGSTSATSMEALLSGLERDNLELIEVDTKSRGVSGDMVQDVTGREKVSRRELADLFFQLSVLLQSGVTLLKALDLVGG